MKVSVIIPTLNAEKWIAPLLERLRGQTLPPAEILVADSRSADRTREIAARAPGVRVLEVTSFNHGGTRDMAMRESRGEVAVFMTQDAQPASGRLLEQLCAALEQAPRAAAAYARQLPREDALPRERLVRMFSYPAEGAVHDAASVASLGLRAFYLSNVCAAYRRDVYEELGGFEKDLRSNEDMLYAAKAIRAGYSVVYAAGAEVIHSHNLSLGEQYRRNRLQGYELARHRALLENDSPVSSGKEMFLRVAGGLLREGRIGSFCAFCADCGARYLGNRAGKREFEKNAKD